MEQKTLSNWLKFILVGVGICGLLVYGGFIPMYGQAVAARYPEYAYCYIPWLLFLWGTGIPCYAVLILGWKIADNIGKDRSFSQENAKLFQWISILAALDTVFFFLMNIVYLFCGMNHPGIVLYAMFIVFAGVAVTIVAAVLSCLVRKAAGLQAQSDLTI